MLILVITEAGTGAGTEDVAEEGDTNCVLFIVAFVIVLLSEVEMVVEALVVEGGGCGCGGGVALDLGLLL